MRWIVAIVVVVFVGCAGADGDPAPPAAEAGPDAGLAPCDDGGAKK